jgi:hypothetical protein
LEIIGTWTYQEIPRKYLDIYGNTQEILGNNWEMFRSTWTYSENTEKYPGHIF